MLDSVIFSSPSLIALYGIALVITLFEKWQRAGAVLPWAAVILVMVTSGVALIMGASLLETATVIVGFLIVNLAGQREGNG